MTDKLRVLLVEDSESDARLILRALQRTGAIVESARVENAADMRAALEAGTYDAIVSDWSLPQFSGLEALAVLKSLGLDLPFLLVSGTIGEESAVDAMRAGAHDYVLKGNLARLSPAIERAVRDAEQRRARRAAEATLRAQEVRFRAIIEHSQDGIILTARDGTTLYVSPAAKRILHLGTGQDADCAERIHPEDRARWADFQARLAGEPGFGLSTEVRLLLPDASVRWMESTGTNLLDEPDVNAVVVSLRDVTERKLALDALRVSEQRFARLYESGIVGIALADVFGNVREANDAFLELVGLSRDEVRDGIPGWAEVTAPGWAEADAHATDELRRHGVARPWEKELLRTDGTRVPVLVGFAMLDGPNCIAFVADLSARKKAEAALRRTEEQLQHAQKMEAIGLLAGGVAHDFNNLLSVILSFSEMLMQDLPATDPMWSDVNEIKEAGLRAAALTRQLLAFSRQQVTDPKVLDLNEIIHGVDKMVRRILGEDIELTTIPHPALDRCRADAGQMEQVLVNLVVNARDAMPEGGKLTIETGNVELDETYARAHLGVKPGRHVMLAVSDTGTGMDKATQARIFEPFFTTKEKGKGTGLGLSTVFGIVEQSHGTIWVYSEVGQGTTFKVYLPVTDERPVGGIARPPSGEVRGSETILLVEDEDQIRKVARGILQRHGYVVIECRNAGEALLACERHGDAIDLLVTDVVMPQMSGPQLADRLAALRPDMGVLFMSGYTDGALVGQLSERSAFLQKPLTPGALTRKVREVLDRRRGRSPR